MTEHIASTLATIYSIYIYVYVSSTFQTEHSCSEPIFIQHGCRQSMSHGGSNALHLHKTKDPCSAPLTRRAGWRGPRNLWPDQRGAAGADGEEPGRPELPGQTGWPCGRKMPVPILGHVRGKPRSRQIKSPVMQEVDTWVMSPWMSP